MSFVEPASCMLHRQSTKMLISILASPDESYMSSVDEESKSSQRSADSGSIVSPNSYGYNNIIVNLGRRYIYNVPSPSR